MKVRISNGMNAKKKVSSKTLTNQRRSRRKLLTFWRIIRYGVDSFMRNSWLSVAATAVMTITLLIFFTSFVLHNVLTDTIGELQNKVDMSIYLKTDTPDKEGQKIKNDLKKLSTVKTVEYCSAVCARQQFAKDNRDNSDTLEALKEATNNIPATLRVTITNIDDTTQLEKFVAENATIKKYINSDYKPSFAGERRDTIHSIGRAVNFAQVVGLIAGAVFVIISSLIIFNTIRMAIYNRKEEIQMMKLIGADQSFIRGPFIVEAIIYGIVASFIATGLGIWALCSSAKTLLNYQITIQPTINLVTAYFIIVLLIMAGIGAVIGIVSSFFATRRYLKL